MAKYSIGERIGMAKIRQMEDVAEAVRKEKKTATSKK